MIEFAVERYEDAVDEMRLLYPAHWSEVGFSGPVDPDYEKYETMGPLLHLVTARSEGLLVGYHGVKVSPSSHQKGLLIGVTEAVYLRRSFRKGFNGVKFLKFTCESLKEKGVHRFITTATTRNPFYKILERLGFCEVERVYAKVLS